MAATKYTDYFEFHGNTFDYTIVTNQTKNGYISNVHYRVDWSEEYEEAYGLVDVKLYETTNQNVYNAVYQVPGEEPIHIHFSWDV